MYQVHDRDNSIVIFSISALVLVLVSVLYFSYNVSVDGINYAEDLNGVDNDITEQKEELNCLETEYEKNKKCSEITTCEIDEIEVKASTKTSDRECGCDYEKSFKKDGKCIDIKSCTENEVETSAPTKTLDRKCDCDYNVSYMKNGKCTSLTTCNADEYETKTPTKYTDRKCSKVSTCNENELETSAPTKTSDRKCDCDYEAYYKENETCNEISNCSDNKVETSAPTKTSNRQCDCDYTKYYKEGGRCKKILECLPDEFEEKSPTQTSNRICKKRKVCGDMEVGKNVYNKDTVCVKHPACTNFGTIECTQGHYGKCSFVYMTTTKGPSSNDCIHEVSKINKLANGTQSENYPFKCFYTGGAGSYLRLTKNKEGAFADSGSSEKEDLSNCKKFSNTIKRSGLDVSCHTDKYQTSRYHYLGFSPKCKK